MHQDFCSTQHNQLARFKKRFDTFLNGLGTYHATTSRAIHFTELVVSIRYNTLDLWGPDQLIKSSSMPCNLPASLDFSISSLTTPFNCTNNSSIKILSSANSPYWSKAAPK